MSERVRYLLGQLAEEMGVMGSPVPQTPSPSPSTSTATPLQSLNSTTNRATPVVGGHPSTLSEVRRLFSPYPQPGNRSLRFAGRSAPPRRVGTQRPVRNWSARFCCLGHPNELTTPNDNRLLELHNCGLGIAIVTSGFFSSSDDLKESIRTVFPKLNTCEFELMRALSGGRGKQIVRICSNEPIPSAEYLRSSRLSVTYIKPGNDIMPQILAYAAEAESEPAFPRLPMATQLAQPSTEQHNEQTSVQVSTPVNDNSVSLEILTLEDYRRQLYYENPGYQFVQISRDNYLEKVLGVYKSPTFDFKKEPKIEFMGEAGNDVGALSREYFWKGIMAIVNDRLDGKNFFEGESNHYIPSADSKLLRSGIFQLVGKFLAHAIIHAGVGFIGLSQAVVEYLTIDEVNSDTPLTLEVDDISDLSVRHTISKVLELKSGATLTDEDLQEIGSVAQSAEFLEPINKSTAYHLHEHLLYHHIIEKRIRQLDTIKAELKSSGIIQFLSGKEYLLPAVFPKIENIQYPVSLILEKISCDGDPQTLETVKEYIRNLADNPQKLQDLLCAWTGWAIISSDPLKIRVESDIDFAVHSCFNEMCIPKGWGREQIFYHLDLLVNYSSAGFGII